MNTGNLDIPDSGGFARAPAKVVADPAWRRQERRRPRWVFWLAGLAGLSLAGSAAMLMLGAEPRHPAEAPLITADPTPVRVRPDDPGGLRVPNLDKAVYDQLARSGQGDAGARRPQPRVESLLPPPEAPQPLPVEPVSLTPGPSPQQLAREPEQPARPPQPAIPAAPAPQGAAPAATAAVAPMQATPAPSAAAPPAPAASAPAASAAVATVPREPPPAVAPQAGTGRIQVQLAAVPSEQAATAEWERLRRRMPDLLGNQRLIVSRGEREGQPFWRVRTGAFSDSTAARAFCDQVRQRGGSCFVAPAG
ncbi:MAG: SPOR domain-containing protein [Acetobacteraceae bacterium]|jgi:hypothetical protein|nr:SPOR domain-containing protein [Acetobacteraceae bacterium]